MFNASAFAVLVTVVIGLQDANAADARLLVRISGEVEHQTAQYECAPVGEGVYRWSLNCGDGRHEVGEWRSDRSLREVFEDVRAAASKLTSAKQEPRVGDNSPSRTIEWILVTNGEGHTVREAISVNGTLNTFHALAEDGPLWFEVHKTVTGKLEKMYWFGAHHFAQLEGGSYQRPPHERP